MSQEFFRTSFGRSIRCVPGYFEVHPTVSAPGDVLAPEGGFQGQRPFGIDGFIKDVYTYALMMDFLQNLGVSTRWKRALDIGGAEGTMSRLLRGQRRAEWAATLDLYDFGSLFSTAACLRHSAKLRVLSEASRFSPAIRRFLLGDGEWRGKRLTVLYPNFGYVPPQSSVFWRLDFTDVPRIDEYITKNLYDLDGHFDLITSFCCLPCFDVEQKFRKVSELLEEGGTFYMLTDSWWFPVNSAMIIGHFPYVAQRLSAEDFQRYLREFHPADYGDFMARYNYFHMGKARPTLDDYVALADRFDMELLGTRRLSPPYMTHNRAVATPRLLNRLTDTRLDEVLEDIHQFRPDVGLTDLTSNYMMAAFVKRPPRQRTLREHLGAGSGSRG